MLILVVNQLYALPKGFVYLKDIEPSIIEDMRYASSDNFVGRVIHGYKIDRCILTRQAANKLKKAQKIFLNQGYSIKVYDCYRPTRAVKDFYHWRMSKDKRMKSYFYPREKKSLLFDRGYIAEYSGHSRGSTVDLSLVEIGAKKTKPKQIDAACYAKHRQQDNSVDMGTNFDCLDVASYYAHRDLTKKQKANRQRLRQVMMKVGFKPYKKEWWHFSLRREPYPRRYFNFDVK